MIPLRRGCLLLLATAWRVAVAQESNAPPGGFAVGTELGLNAARGNANYTMMSSSFRLTHLNRKLLELDWLTGFNYGESNKKVIARRLVSSLKADWNPQATWSFFVFGSGERDVTRRLDLLSTTGMGEKWTYYRTTITGLSLSVAAVHTYKQFAPLPPSSSPPPPEPRRSTARVSIRPRFVQRRPTGWSFEQMTFWQPVFNAISDYMLEADSRVGYAVTKTSTVFAQHTYRHDSRPPSGVGRDDQLMVAGVKVQF